MPSRREARWTPELSPQGGRGDRLHCCWRAGGPAQGTLMAPEQPPARSAWSWVPCGAGGGEDIGWEWEGLWSLPLTLCTTGEAEASCSCIRLPQRARLIRPHTLRKGWNSCLRSSTFPLA